MAFVTLLIFGIYGAALAQRDSIYRLPVGTRIKLKLDAELSSRVSSVGDTFIASIAQPVVIREVIVLPAGTEVEGRVFEAKPASAGGRSGKLDLSFLTIRWSNELIRDIDGMLVTKLKAKPSSFPGLLSIFGGAAVGAIFGGITRSSRNILLGGGIGAGVGTAIAMRRKGNDVKIGKGVEFEIELKREVVLPVSDY